ncbi:MAG TPA: alpha/beta hydrolase [Kosmotogaceae bacterium]|nr:alpha/beta hydrolase [Kosmotogaceae bacterium]
MKLVYILIALLALVVATLIVPIPEPAGALSHRELAEEDSMFADILGMEIHYKVYGEGEPTFLLLHGFGASLFSWRDLVSPLSEYGKVIAFDRPGFGLTERVIQRRWDDIDPYSPAGQVEATIRLMDYLGIEEAVLVGHSAGGAVAVETMITHPDRVIGAVLIAPAVFVMGPPNNSLLWLMRNPWGRKYGPLLLRRLTRSGSGILDDVSFDSGYLTEEDFDRYMKPFRVVGWDRALWQFTLSSQEERPDPDLLKHTVVPVLIVMGSDDTLIPLEHGERLRDLIEKSTYVVMSETGHLPHEEQPKEFMQILFEFLHSELRLPRRVNDE